MKLFLVVALGASLGISLAVANPVWAQDAIAAPQIAPGKAPFNWQIRLLAGQKFRTTIDTSSKMMMPIPAFPGAPDKPVKATAPMETNTKSHMVFDQNVLSSDEKGAHIEMIYREATQSIDMSENGVPNETVKNAPDITTNLVGARLVYTLSSRGKISDIQGVEETIERMLDDTGDGFETEQQQQLKRTLRGQMKTLMSQSAIESTIGRSFGVFPTAPVAPGESWKINTVSPVMMGLTVSETGTRTFIGREGDLVVLNEVAAISSDPDKKLDLPLPPNSNAQTPASTLKMAMKGTSHGETKIDEKTGMVRSNHSSQKVHTTTSMENIDGQGGKMEMAMDMTADTKSKTELLPATADGNAPEAPPATQ